MRTIFTGTGKGLTEGDLLEANCLTSLLTYPTMRPIKSLLSLGGKKYFALYPALLLPLKMPPILKLCNEEEKRVANKGHGGKCKKKIKSCSVEQEQKSKRTRTKVINLTHILMSINLLIIYHLAIICQLY